ncbi:MAG: hypothetical protein BECKG1743F_GA0114225_100173 [Candidatus Kentron sp. G]|nr:MAG: hypothetical protein BECKG1743F_GA0114225_100173 [Candidatus Kentron sp. G]
MQKSSCTPNIVKNSLEILIYFHGNSAFSLPSFMTYRASLWDTIRLLHLPRSTAWQAATESKTGPFREGKDSNDFPTARQEPRPPVGFVPRKTSTRNRKLSDSRMNREELACAVPESS